MASTPPWPPTMDAEAEEFGKRLTKKYGGRVDYLGWVRWSSDFRMLRGNEQEFETTWSLIERNIDLINSGQPEQPYPPGPYDVPWPPTMDEEAKWFGPKLEAFYADPGGRPSVDYLGWVRWSSDYRVHRANGISPERAWTRIENDIRQIWGLPVVIPPPSPFPKRTGNVTLRGRSMGDDNGPFLALGYTGMHEAATCAKFPDVFREDSRILASHGFTYTRKIAFLDGGFLPPPDPWLWEPDQGAGNTSIDRIVDAINIGYDEAGLRTFLTVWGGLKNWPSQQNRRDALSQLLPRLKPIKHKLLGGEVTNEEWMNWTSAGATYADMRELATMVQNALGPNFPMAMSAPQGVAEDMQHPNENFAGIRDMYYNNPASNVATFHFSRTVNKIDTIWRPYRQPWENVIHVPNEEIARHLGLPVGTQLTPNASINNEPIGPYSSGAADDNPDRQVIAAVVTFVSGECAYDCHADQGVWRDQIYPDYKRPDRGMTARLMDVKNISLILEGFAGMIRMLPGDLPSWSRTRHGFDTHPFAPSFVRQGDGYTQIWPDGVTHYGVVRAYCAIKGNNFLCPLLGVKDHFDLIAAHKMNVVLIRPGGWETIATFTLNANEKHVVTYPEVVAVGQYV